MVKNLPSNAGDVGSIPGQGTKTSHVARPLSPHAISIELTGLNETDCELQTTDLTCSGAHAPQLKRETPQLERSLRATTKSPRAATKDPTCLNQDPACHN